MIQELSNWKSLRRFDKVLLLEKLANHPLKEIIIETLAEEIRKDIESFILDHDLFYLINSFDISIDVDDFLSICEHGTLETLEELIPRVKQFKDGYLVIEPRDQTDLIFCCSEGDLSIVDDKVRFLLSVFDKIYQDTVKKIFEFTTLCANDIAEFNDKMTFRAKIALIKRLLDPDILDQVVNNIPRNQLRTIISECFVNFCICNKCEVLNFVFDLYDKKKEEVKEKIRDL